MKDHQKLLTFVSGLLLFFVLCSSFVRADEEVDDEREFSYVKGSKNGPEHWGDLRKEWGLCKNGTMQSPIDLSRRSVKVVPKFPEFRRHYLPCNASIENRGHDILIHWNGYKAGKIKINGTDYYLQQVHWHSPSEHTIQGRRYHMELHLVHVSKFHKLAVVAILYKIGPPDAFLTKLINNMKTTSEKGQEKNMGEMDPREIKMKGKKYYRYIGSLTVPPCTEGVVWTINKKIETVSEDQIKVLRAAVHDHARQNARPLQPLNHREIDLYGPKPTRKI